jgi:hypothetical protein
LRVTLVPEQIVLSKSSDEAVTVGKVNKDTNVGLVALFDAVVTTIFPACGVASVVIVMLLAVLFVIVQASPFSVTEVAEPKLVPVIVIVACALGQTVVGKIDVIAGPAAACVK